jgi:hypothetical protein
MATPRDRQAGYAGSVAGAAGEAAAGGYAASEAGAGGEEYQYQPTKVRLSTFNSALLCLPCVHACWHDALAY